MTNIKGIFRSFTAAAALCLAVGAQANIVTNSSFETGDFTGWSQSGNQAFDGVFCPGAGTAQDGVCASFFGAIGSESHLSQTLSTVAGATYDISFWLGSDGSTPNSFFFNWDGGAVELALTDIASSFVEYTLHLAASSGVTTIDFGFRNDPGFTLLDNVNVTAAAVTDVPEPGSLALLGLGLAGLAAIRRRKQA